MSILESIGFITVFVLIQAIPAYFISKIMIEKSNGKQGVADTTIICIGVDCIIIATIRDSFSLGSMTLLFTLIISGIIDVLIGIFVEK